MKAMDNDGIIRILITQDCMYKCFFCHKEGVNRICEEKLDVEDIVYLMKTLKRRLNKNTVRLSGGEPLIRNDIINLAKELAKNNIKIFMTSNISLLDQKSEICKYLEKLNVSIHSLDEANYKKITNSNVNIDKILNTVKNVHIQYPNLNITIDTTLLKGLNTGEEEIQKYIDFSEANNVNVKFIELFSDDKEFFYPIDNIKSILLSKGYKIKENRLRRDIYIKNDNTITVSKCFCASEEDRKKLGNKCKKHNDLFITADGKISLCRVGNEEIDILKEIKERDEENLIKKFKLAYEKLGDFCLKRF